jgi:Ni,Fe-hydrogenase I small subunit
MRHRQGVLFGTDRRWPDVLSISVYRERCEYGNTAQLTASSVEVSRGVTPRVYQVLFDSRKSLSQSTRTVLVWLDSQDYPGTSESMLRTNNTRANESVLYLSWGQHSLIMAGAGKHTGEVFERVVSQEHLRQKED